MDAEFARYALSGIEAAIEKMQRQAAELRSIIGATTAGVMAAVGRGRGRPAGSTAPAVKTSNNLANSKASQPSHAPSAAVGSTPGRRRTMSPEARRRISEAQKARWAKQKDEAATESRERGSNRPGSGVRRTKKR